MDYEEENQEQQGQEEGVFNSASAKKGKSKLSDIMRDDKKKKQKNKIPSKQEVIKKVISIGIKVAVVIIGVVLLAGFMHVIKPKAASDTNDAKAGAISTTYSTNASTTTTDENGNEVNRVAVTVNANKTGYEIAYNNDADYIENVRDNLEEGIVDSASDFTDFELAVLGALMENGADLDYFSEEELHCIPAFIKVEACTQNLDLRPNSEKQNGKKTGEYVDNYEPKKVKDLAENEVPGVILVQRTNTNGTKTTLEYIDESTFNDYITAQEKETVINKFTINDKGEIVYAKWDNTKIEIEGDYPENLPESKKDIGINDDFVVPDKIPYAELVKEYTMPFEFLVQLLVITEEPDFCMELVNYALDSKIVINIQEEETVTVTVEEKTYDSYYKEEKLIDYNISPNVETKTNYLIRTKNGNTIIDDTQTDCTIDDENKECTVYEYESTTKPVIVTTTKTEHTYKWELIEADNWLARYTKDYETGYDISKEKIETTPIKDEIVEELGTYEPAENIIIEDSQEILKDIHADSFKKEKEKYYKDKVAIPQVSVIDGIDNEGTLLAPVYKYWKQINIKDLGNKFETSLESIDTKYERITRRNRDGETIYMYYMPSSFTVTTIKTGDLIGEITYEYGINNDYTYSLVNTNKDDVLKCNISKLVIRPYNKINTTIKTNQKVTKFPANENPRKKTEIYAVDSNGDFRKFLKAYDNSEGAQNQLNSIDSWLFEMMEENENTVELVDKVKYLLYEYDGVDRGVTELEGFEEIFEPEEFVQVTNGGSALWNNDITKEEFVNIVKSYSVPSGSGSYGTYKWGYEKYFIPNAENFYNIATKYGLDPRFIFSIGIHESEFGTSTIANKKGNFFGWGANDSNPYGDAHSFYDMSSGIEAVCKGIANDYISPSGAWYQWITDRGYDPTTINGIGCRYASDPNWSTAVTQHMKNIFKYEPTVIANADFLTIAKECHDYIRTNDFYYSSAANKSAGKYVGDGTSTGNGKIPYPNGTQYTDCSAYITWVLYQYGYTELTSQKTSSWFMNRDAMAKMGWTVLPVSKAEAGDIVAKNGHVEIYAGNGKFYNAGSTEAIRKEISNSGVKYLNTFTYAIRVTKP